MCLLASSLAFVKACIARRVVGRAFVLGALVVGVLGLAGCSGSGGARQTPPDQRYGHRYEEAGPEGRRTLTLAAPDSGAEYALHDVPVSEVIVRADSFAQGEAAVPVEVLIKGALPNECLALHAAAQERDGHFLDVSFTMRWPTGGSERCERFERPFRFYLPLEGRYEPGDYTLTLNGTVYPFTIRRE